MSDLTNIFPERVQYYPGPFTCLGVNIIRRVLFEADTLGLGASQETQVLRNVLVVARRTHPARM